MLYKAHDAASITGTKVNKIRINFKIYIFK